MADVETGHELASLTEHSESEEDEDQGKFHVPDGLKMVEPDGTVVYKKLGLAAATKAAPKCIPAPTGGWAGPFGFYRLLSYIFIAVIIADVVLFLLACIWGFDVMDILTILVLGFVALICAYAAYAHEGLANEVSEIAQQNSRFANSNDVLAKKIKEMSKVGDRLTDISKTMAMSETQLGDTITILKRLTTCEQLTTVLSAFINADQMGDSSQRIEGDEVCDFMKSIHVILEKACPDRDFKEMRDEMEDAGLDLGGVRMLINGVASSGHQCPKKTRAEMDLIMFSLNSKTHLAEVKQSVWSVLAPEPDKKAVANAPAPRTQNAVTADLEKLKAGSTHNHFDCSMLVPLSKEIMSVSNKEKTRGLCKPSRLAF